RWLSRDLPGNPRHNLLPYVRNDPINLVDRFGLEESRPDLLRVETGSEFLDNVLGDLKSLWDKTPWAEKTTKPAEEFYDHAETAIEAYNDAEKISKLAGNCDIGQLHDPSQNSWDGNLKNSGREGLEILKIGSKWLDRLTHVVKGLDWVTGPATQLGSGVAEAGA
ncbi:MAG TPA: hypothetical protein DCY13_22595, partial [Verrucomicrobiales bacterium]|nr:hypothetical protein [Verrucomicrobiales bacterium]